MDMYTIVMILLLVGLIAAFVIIRKKQQNR
jgi:LPXTG-motif cell wall-anchored protein